MDNVKILIADDEAGIRLTLDTLLRPTHSTTTVDSGEEAVAILQKEAFDLVISDLRMKTLSGIDVLKFLRSSEQDTAFVLMTAHGTLDDAISALNLGADDFVLKPFTLEEIEHRIRKIEEAREANHRRLLERDRKTSRFIGTSKCVQDARTFAEQVAKVNTPVLILGPSGSGKEVLAQSIHELSNIASHPFVAVNCASLSENLIESELFGHEKGAFTGATERKIGKFECADGGTLFLDELGELGLNVQARLLRVLQEREFYRLGGTRIIRSSARIIAATNRDLKKMTEIGTFREDLYYRLNVMQFELKPLKERKSDIPLLVEYFWQRFTKEFKRSIHLSGDVRELVMNYTFPGNVRELGNMIERLFVLVENEEQVKLSDLPHSISKSEMRSNPLNQSASSPDSESLNLETAVEELEKRLIKQAMGKSQENQSQAALLLGLSRGTLQYKLKKYGF